MEEVVDPERPLLSSACCICYEQITDELVLPCRHKLDKHCFVEYMTAMLDANKLESM